MSDYDPSPTENTPRSHNSIASRGTIASGALASPSALQAALQIAGGCQDDADAVPRVYDADDRPRGPLDPATVAETARRLFARIDESHPSGWRSLLRREVPHFYAPNVMRGVDMMFADTVKNRQPLYLQGAASGVGTTIFCTDFARGYNQRRSEAGSAERVLYASLEEGTDAPVHFFDTLGLYVKAPLTRTDLRFRSAAYLATKVVAAAARLHAAVLVIDHVQNAGPRVLALIGAILRHADPRNVVSDVSDEYARLTRRIGVVLVSTSRPQVLFRDVPQVLLALKGRHRVLNRYKTIDDVGEALRQARIGLDDLDAESNDEDRLIATRVLETTAGLPALMHPLFEMIDLVAQSNRMRPNGSVINAALGYHRRFVDVLRAAPDKTSYGSEERDERLAVVAASDHTRLVSLDGTSEYRVRRPSAGGKEAVLKMHGRQRSRAVREGRRIANKGHTNVKGIGPAFEDGLGDLTPRGGA